MGKIAAKKGDQIVGVDIHLVKIPMPAPTPVPLPNPFSGEIEADVSEDVEIEGKGAAIMGSKAQHKTGHIPTGLGFDGQPKDEAKCFIGSPTVLINGKPAMRDGDIAMTCNFPTDLPMGMIKALPCKVLIG